jgi:cytoskeleton protein RodZ
MTNNTTANNTIDPCQLVAGQMLARQREKLGLSVEECANTLKLSVTKINALEIGDSKPFISETFIRGYLKSYAKLLNLSEADVIEGYQSQQANYTCAGALEPSADESATSKWWLPYLMGAVIIGLWFAVSSHLESQKKLALAVGENELLQADAERSLVVEDEFTEKTEQDNVSAELNVASDIEVDAPMEVLVPQDGAAALLEQENTTLLLSEPEEGSSDPVEAEGSEIFEEGNTSPVEVPVVLLETPHVIDELVSRVGDTVNEGDDQLFFTFAEACWVEIVDADNITIVSSLRSEDTQLLVRGKAPFFIILGNISGTTLHFNEKSVALDNSRDGRTLRLNLGS